MNATTLTALLQANRSAARSITYLEGEHERRVVPLRRAATSARSASSTTCSGSARGRATS